MKYIVLLFLLVIFPNHFLHAQSNLEYGEQQLTIDLEPAFPAPESEFTASANDYALPISGVGIKWYVDGKLIEEAINARDLKLVAKKVGVSTTIKLVIPLPGGGSVSTEKIIKPAFLDVIIEPQTRVPAFYTGRSLPSIGSTVNATAILNGNVQNTDNLIYTWSLNNQALLGGSVRGKKAISFTMPQGSFATLNLEIRTDEGEPVARRVFDILSQEPEISFYEVSTLYGLKQKAILDSIPLIGSSITVSAEPFYLDLNTYNNPDYIEWKISGYKSANASNNPYEITLASEGGSGLTPVDFHVRNTVQLLQGAKGNFQVTY